jgi:hypothetical protein
MRGYLSFILVLVSLQLVFSFLDVKSASESTDLSKALSVERTYSVHMNVKESVLEAARQGAREGFAAYDVSHDIRLCRHCPDAYCSVVPAAPNRCDLLLCEQCFREHEARAEAEKQALSTIGLLRSHQFDSDFWVTIGGAEIEAFTKTDVTAKNSYALDYLRLREDLPIRMESEKLGLSAAAKIPRGVVIEYESPGDS